MGFVTIRFPPVQICQRFETNAAITVLRRPITQQPSSGRCRLSPDASALAYPRTPRMFPKFGRMIEALAEYEKLRPSAPTEELQAHCRARAGGRGFVGCEGAARGFAFFFIISHVLVRKGCSSRFSSSLLPRRGYDERCSATWRVRGCRATAAASNGRARLE